MLTMMDEIFFVEFAPMSMQQILYREWFF